jgi:hypothetical protein
VEPTSKLAGSEVVIVTEDKSGVEVVVDEQEVIAKVKVVTKPIISQKPTKRL